MLVSELMERSPVSVAPEDSCRDAARLLSRYSVGALPVVNADGMLRGILTDRDIVLRCLALGKDPDGTPVRDCMTRQVVTVSPRDRVETAAERMAHRHQVGKDPDVGLREETGNEFLHESRIARGGATRPVIVNLPHDGTSRASRHKVGEHLQDVGLAAIVGVYAAPLGLHKNLPPSKEGECSLG